MPRQANIVSFDAARRAASGTRAPGQEGRARAGRILIGGDQSAIVDDLPGVPPRASRRANVIELPRRDKGNPTPSWYDRSKADLSRDDDVFARPASSRASRFADDDGFADDYEEELERTLDEKARGPLGRFLARSSKKRRERTKERADRAYFRQYEAGKSSDAAQGGPRAAVYKGEMGSAHKRSSRMQQQAAATPASKGRAFRAPSEKGPLVSRPPFMGFVATVVCLVVGAAFLYSPAQQLYVDIRERDRLAAEYEAVVQRNEAIGEQVEALSTDEGVKDMARTELGWVSEGEHAVSVSGLNLKKDTSFRGNIVSEDIELPDTWYSGVLDPLFGIK